MMNRVEGLSYRERFRKLNICSFPKRQLHVGEYGNGLPVFGGIQVCERVIVRGNKKARFGK